MRIRFSAGRPTAGERFSFLTSMFGLLALISSIVVMLTILTASRLGTECRTNGYASCSQPGGETPAYQYSRGDTVSGDGA